MALKILVSNKIYSVRFELSCGENLAVFPPEAVFLSCLSCPEVETKL